jgi:tellurite resistance protein TerC
VKKAKRILVALVEGTVLTLGIALVVLPGPAFLVIPAGLAALAMVFDGSGCRLGQASAKRSNR